jgi:hypothetical protein
VARALHERAEGFVREKGIKRINRPMGLNANQEIGILVDGFEHPPVLDMGHSRRWQGGLVEQCGYAKEKDLYAWRYDDQTKLPDRVQKAWESVQQLPEVKMRSVNTGKLREELGVIMEMYNDTWAGKWGYVPITSKELDKMAADLSLVLDPAVAFIAEIDGKAGGMCIMVPNLNEAVADLGGSLFPFGWAKLLWRTKVKRPSSTRLILLGVREHVRKNVKRYGALSAAMMVEVRKRGIERGYEWSELGWTREGDAPINLGIRSMGAKIYKTYRIYDKKLG